jgi:hypothetical protein
MPEKKTLARARRAKRRGMSPSSQAGEFVHEEIRHVRRGKHGARSSKQAIAIGLSKARRAGVELPPPPRGKARSTRKRGKPAPSRSRATRAALKREAKRTVSKKQLSRQARAAAKRRGPKARKAAARKAARTRKRRSGR